MGNDPRFAVNPPWPDLPLVNAVLNGRGQHYHVERYRTTLSLKSVVRGEAIWRTRRGVFRIDPTSFLVLNDGQEYSLDFEPRVTTETLCVFFAPGFVEGVRDGATRKTRDLLDDPFGHHAEPLGVVERLHEKSDEVAATLERLWRTVRSPAHELEDAFYALAGDLVRLHDRTAVEARLFPGARAATRAELYRRLHLARDYVASCYGEPLTVARIARIAALSPYHFQRLFKEAFGVTPMQCLQERRLSMAQRLVTETERDITSIALDVGFESPSSFSWLFRRRFGRSPLQLRRSLRAKTAGLEK